MSRRNLRTNRPYRPAMEVDAGLAQLERGAGPDFDMELVTAFMQMMRQWERRVAVVDDKTTLPSMAGPAQTAVDQAVAAAKQAVAEARKSSAVAVIPDTPTSQGGGAAPPVSPAASGPPAVPPVSAAG